MMKMSIVIFILLVSSISFQSGTVAFGFESVLAQAKGSRPPTGAAGEKTKSLSFEDELVEGATAKPELFYLFQKKNFNFKRLIKLRENFVPEMRRTSEDVQRGRGGN
jgi:hypothetical protein